MVDEIEKLQEAVQENAAAPPLADGPIKGAPTNGLNDVHTDPPTDFPTGPDIASDAATDAPVDASANSTNASTISTADNAASDAATNASTAASNAPANASANPTDAPSDAPAGPNAPVNAAIDSPVIAPAGPYTATNGPVHAPANPSDAPANAPADLANPTDAPTDAPDEMVDIGPTANRLLASIAASLPAGAPRAGYKPCPRPDTFVYVNHRTAKARVMVSEQARITTSLSVAAMGLGWAEREVEGLRRELEVMKRSRANRVRRELCYY